MQKISFTLAMLALVLVVGFAVSATFVSCDNESVWLLTDERPSHISTLRNVEILSAGPFTLTFDEEKRGPRVFYAARWLGSKKQPSPARAAASKAAAYLFGKRNFRCYAV